MIKLKTLLPKHIVVEAMPGQIGAVAAATNRNKGAADSEEPSSASDEFYMWVNYNPVYNKSAQFNCKLENVEIYKQEEKPEGGGFFKKLGAKISKALGGDSTVTLTFSSPRIKEKIGLILVSKDNKFKAATLSSSSEQLQAAITKEHAPKFINYLINQSKWKNELKQSFPDIDKQLTPESFEAIKLK